MVHYGVPMTRPFSIFFLVITPSAGAQTPSIPELLQQAVQNAQDGKAETASSKLEEAVNQIVLKDSGNAALSHWGDYASARQIGYARTLTAPGTRHPRYPNGEITDFRPVRIRIGRQISYPMQEIIPRDGRWRPVHSKTAVEIVFFNGFPPITLVAQTARIELLRPIPRISIGAGYAKNVQRYDIPEARLPVTVKLRDNRYYADIHFDLSRRK